MERGLTLNIIRDRSDISRRIQSMHPGEYIIDNEHNIHIVARTVVKNTVTFTCPFCWTEYKRDDTPSKNATKVTHVHGTGGNINNSIYHREPHCDPSHNTNRFIIYVTSKTIR